MIAYKVFSKSWNGNSLTSCMMVGIPLIQTYYPNIKATANIGGFLCFKRKKDAIEFSHCNSLHEVWRVEVEENVRLPSRRVGVGCNAKSCTLLWRGMFTHPATTYAAWPEGTIAYRCVTPREKVE